MTAPPHSRVRAVIGPDDVATADPSELGGKAVGLRTLQALGHRVPPWFALSSRVAGAGAGVPLAPEVEAEVREAYRQMFDDDRAVAVRSSATVEDSPAHSFAGQFESVLSVRGEDALLHAVRTCLASASSARSLAYHRLQGLDPGHTRMAVVVQAMVPARVSGVMTTTDPVAATEAVLISAVPGVAADLVGGTSEGETYRVDRATRQVTGSAGASTLAEDDVQALAAVALRIEAELGAPQEIEWAMDGEGLWLVQVRPAPASAASAAASAERIVWDNANIVESFPGVTLPLTFSVARAGYAAVYRRAGKLAGVPREVLDAHDRHYQSMIGLVRGRIYYNLNSWYELLSLLPGFGHNKGFMEQMMGTRSTPEAAPSPAEDGHAPGRLRLAVRIAVLALTLGRRSAAFGRMVDECAREAEEARLPERSLAELVALYQRLERHMHEGWDAPIVNDFLTMVFYGVLGRLLQRAGHGDDPAIRNELLGGIGGMRSVEPALALVRLAQDVGADDRLSSLFDGHPDADVCTLLESDPDLASFLARVDDYRRLCAAHGQELKLEVAPAPPTREAVISTLRLHVDRLGAHSPAAPAGTAVGGVVLSWVANRTRWHLRERENLRLGRARVFGVARRIFTAAGDRLYEAGVVKEPGDVFYLTAPEIVSISTGEGTGRDWRSVVADRRRAYERHQAQPPPPDRFETRGMPDDETLLTPCPPSPEVGGDGIVLRGQACSAGVARGRPCVVASLADSALQAGDVLVTRQATPDWVTLFPLAQAIVIERGSPLSHSAVVARELGIPAVVGVAGVTEAVRDRDLVEVDGTRGTVRVVGGRP